MPVVTLPRVLVGVAATAVFAVSGWAAQQPYQLGRVATVETAFVDFLALQRNGLPVSDLEPSEVVLKVDGRVRPVGGLQLIDFTEASGESLSLSGDPLPPPFGSNVLGASRTIVVLIDEDSIRPGRERAMLSAVSELIASVSPRTRIVIATPHGGWKTNLTTDRADVRRVASQIIGRGFEGDDVECRTRATLDAVQAALAPFSAEAAPTVLVISGGLAGPRQELTDSARALVRASGPAQARTCDLRIEDFLKVADVTAATRAHLYVIQPDDVAPVSNIGQSPAAAVDLQAGLAHLAGVAGGKLLHLTPSSRNPLIAAERESSAYYLLSFEPIASDQRAAHRFEIEVTRRNVTVIRRPQMMFVRTGVPTTGPPAIIPEAMLSDPRTRRELLMRTAGFALRNPDPLSSRRIVVFAEPIDSSVAFASAAAGLFDTNGQLVSKWTSTAGALSSGPLVAALAAPPGTYRLRVSAVDGSGRAGTADYFVEAALESAGPLKLSAVMLGTLTTGNLRPALEFSNESNAVALLEIYGERDGKPIVATLEIASSLNGPAIVTAPLPVAPTTDADRFVATASIPIRNLAPADYVVRVTVNLQGQPQGRVMRTLRKR